MQTLAPHALGGGRRDVLAHKVLVEPGGDVLGRTRLLQDQVDHLLCHYSARSLREEIVSVLKSTAAMIPEEKWFSNLPTVGNIGAASIWVMLDEFMKSGRAKKGEKVLLIVPESGRAMVGFMMCEVV